MSMLLRLHHLGRRYGGLTALHDLDLDLPEGARHAVIGPNGAGKTTLLNLIAGTLQPSHGTITYRGHDITRESAAARARRGIARTFQHPAIFRRLTVAANLTLASRRAAERRSHAEELLAGAGLADKAGIPAGQLPYGLQRRLELAMALASAPRLLLLDEPSAGLDPDQITQLATQLTALPADVAILLVDHHLDLVWQFANTVTVLHHGRHLTTATPDEVRSDPQVRDAYLTTDNPPTPRTTRPTGGPLLQIRDLHASYGGAPVITGIDLDVREGEAVAVLGRNGAGKTTLLNAIAGLLPAAAGSRITLAGQPLAGQPPHQRTHAGMAIVPQGRRLFRPLTVTEHLTAAAPRTSRTAGKVWAAEEIFALLPALARRADHRADRLSGGEQQMLALARALATGPRLLILDEPSEGLAPTVRTQLAETLAELTADGLALLIAEQNLALATALTSRVLALHSGRVETAGPTQPVDPSRQRSHLNTVLGVSSPGFPDTSH